MPKSDEDKETCLKCLIEALEASKEEARKESEEDAMLNAEKADKENGEASSSKEEAGSSKRGWCHPIQGSEGEWCHCSRLGWRDSDNTLKSIIRHLIMQELGTQHSCNVVAVK